MVSRLHEMQRVARIALSTNTSWNVVNFRANLIGALEADGHQVVALAPYDESSSRLEAEICKLIQITIDNKGTNPVLDTKLLASYRRHLKVLNPDIYFSYTIKPNIYGSLAAHSLGIPVVNNVSGLGTAFLDRGPLRLLAEGLYRFAFRWSQRVFFQNACDRALFVQRRIVDESRAGLLPGSGVDLTHFVPYAMPQRASGEPLIALLIGRVLYDKGVGEYVAAAKLLRSEGITARFQILGFMDAKNRTAVDQEAMNKWVSDGTIEYLGASSDVRPHIAAADCVVLPSYREGTSRSLLEAAAMARPLVATDVPGCREAVDDGENGILCRARDSKDLARALRLILNMSPEQRLKMGQAGRRKMASQFDEKLVIESYRAEISVALKSRR